MGNYKIYIFGIHGEEIRFENTYFVCITSMSGVNMGTDCQGMTDQVILSAYTNFCTAVIKGYLLHFVLNSI